jgi:hypothetical protein
MILKEMTQALAALFGLPLPISLKKQRIKRLGISEHQSCT